MPLLFLLPMAAGALGFGGGFLASGGIGKIIKLVVIGGSVYLVYQHTVSK
jgi:uncharacterized membrane protein YtjA (UPF0391 family)